MPIATAHTVGPMEVAISTLNHHLKDTDVIVLIVELGCVRDGQKYATVTRILDARDAMTSSVVRITVVDTTKITYLMNLII